MFNGRVGSKKSTPQTKNNNNNNNTSGKGRKRESTLDLNDFINTLLADSNLTFLVSADPLPLSMISAVNPVLERKAMVISEGEISLDWTYVQQTTYLDNFHPLQQSFCR